jgi:hypothetical protein
MIFACALCAFALVSPQNTTLARQRALIYPALYQGNRVEPVSTLLEAVLQENLVAENQVEVVSTADLKRSEIPLTGTVTDQLRLAQEQRASWIWRPILLRYSGMEGRIEIEVNLMSTAIGEDISDGRASGKFSRTEPASNTLENILNRALADLQRRMLPKATILETRDLPDVKVSRGSKSGYRNGQRGYVPEAGAVGNIHSVTPDNCMISFTRLWKGIRPGDTVIILNSRD